MLQLAKSFSRKPKGRRSSDSLTFVQEGSEGGGSPRSVMDPRHKGHSPSPSQSSIKFPEANTNGDAHHESDSSVILSPPRPRRSKKPDGYTRTLPTKRSNLSHHTSAEQMNGQVIRQIPTLTELLPVAEVDIASYVFYISEERLTWMPRRGSDWDRVLQAAQFFGLQIWSVGQKLNAFDHGKGNSISAASAALSACQVLLSLGHEQARALLPTFTALQELSTLLSDIGRIRDLEHLPQAIQEHATGTFGDLVDLVRNIAAQYQHKVAGLKAGSTANISFDASFGADIDLIWRSKEELSTRIWAHKLGDREFFMTLKQLRWKLQSSSKSQAVTSNRLYDEIDDHLDRSEESCHWFRDVLSQFFIGHEQVLCVTGSQSSGKTVLAEWVEERLARPIDGLSYSVLRYDFAFDSPEEATPVAFLKSIIFKLLEQNVGNVQLHEHIMRAFEGHPTGDHQEADEKVESALWAALRDCLGVVNRHPRDASLILMLDNCDGISGGAPNADNFFLALQKCVSQLSHVRVITFCQQAPTGLSHFRYFVVTETEVREDIKAHLYDVLYQSPHFNDMGSDGGALIDTLVEKARGNWLWAFYVGRILYRQRSKASILNASKDLTSDVLDVLKRVIEQLDLKNNNLLRTLLSLMLVVGRPLAVHELAQLLDVDENATMPPTPFNVSKFISEHCDDIVTVRGGKVRFRTSAVHSYLRAYLGSTSLMSEQEANRELTMKMLAYSRYALAEDGEPSVDELDADFVHSVFSKHPLVGYTVRNWIRHFRVSGFVDSEAEEHLNKEFSRVFPDSVMFALLEKYCWARLPTRKDRELVTYYELALRMRRACFGEQHVVVMQNLINLGLTEQIDTLESNNVGATYFYDAVKVGKEVLPETSSALEDCMTIFLERTETLIMTKRTKLVAFREEMIQLIIQFYRRKDGPSSDQVIYWYKKLAQLYIDIKEEHHATVVFQELYKVTVSRYGGTSSEAKQIGTYFGTLNIVLRGQSVQEIGELEELIFNTSEELEVADSLSLKMWMRLAQSYVACENLFLAERLYVSLWQRITAVSSSPVDDSGVQAHTAKIQIALEYVKFLRELKRTEEASNILICLWAEYEHQNFESEEMLQWIREIGLVCRTFGLLGVSATVLNKVWGLFKLKGRSIEAQRTTMLITEVIEEMSDSAAAPVPKSMAPITATTTTTEVSETLVKDVFEHHLARCQETGADRHLFSVCMALVGMYTSKNNWHQAEEILKRTLELSWNAILSPEIQVKLCEQSVEDNLAAARRLAGCYSRQGLFEMAEKVHLKIFHACFEGLPLEDALLTEAVAALIRFYDEHHRHKEIIGIHGEVLQRYRRDLGAKHPLTIQSLYALADHCKMLGREEFSLHYLEIVTVLNQGISYCHPDAVKAALILCEHYQARGQWVDVSKVCAALWETIQYHRGEYAGFAEASITLVFESYKQALLALDAKMDFATMHKLAVEYKEAIAVVCGFESVPMIKALIAVAEACERQEDHHHESVAIYEDVLEKTTRLRDATNTDSIDAITLVIKKRLSNMYVTIASTGKAAAASDAAPASLDRSIHVALEVYEQLKAEFGCWHEKPLLQLRDVVLLHQKANTKESRALAYQLLQNCAKEIVAITSVNVTLFKSATMLATIFVGADMLAEGQSLLSQMRHLIIFRGQLPMDGLTLDLKSDTSKVLFIFLIAFEHGLGGPNASYSYSQGMSQIVLETLLYEEYSRVVDGDNKLETILESGARLRGFWAIHKRAELLDLLDKRLLPLFQKEYAHCFKGIPAEDVLALYLCLLAELGKDRPATTMDFAALACKAANEKVRELLFADDFHNANQLSRCIFRFAEKQRLYHQRNRIHYGYRLAEYMAGIGVPHPSGVKEQAAIQTAMLDTSKAIMTDIIAAFTTIQIDFTSLRPEDLDGLIRLLSTQRNFVELEALLSRLWHSREALRKSFGCDHAAVIEIGNYLIHAQWAQGRMAVAIDTAKLMYYNLQRGRGRLDSETLKMSRLLASLYVSAKKPGNAMVVHDAVLREIASASDKEQSEKEKTTPDEGTSKAAADHDSLVNEARLHLELLKGAHHLLKGWTRPMQDFHDLLERLNNNLGFPGVAFDQWVKGSKNSPKGEYAAPQTWTIERLIKMGSAKQADSGARLRLVESAMREWVLY